MDPFHLGCAIYWHKIVHAAAAKLLQSCPTLCDPIDGSLPGSTVPGILQARTLEWGAIVFSKNCSQILSNTPFYFFQINSNVPLLIYDIT